MSDVKWIKITTDIFDDEKILLIESLPDAYAIITCWFKLLCLAGKMNNSGVFMMSNSMPYTEKMFATIFRMKESTVSLALHTFQEFGMVEILEGVVTIPNWGKHQNLEQIESRREYMKKYQREYRDKQKQIASSDGDDERKCLHERLRKCLREQNVNTLEEEGEEEREEEGDKNERITSQQVFDLYNRLCPSFPTVKTLSAARRRTINARLKTYTLEDFETLFLKAEASTFLKGGNNKDWSATFDWMIKDSNMAKILDGNYDDRNGRRTSQNGQKQDTAQELDDFYNRAAAWAEGGET